MSETAEWGNVCSRVDTCALTGAAAFFTGIKGAEVLVNGPLWCYFYALRHLEKSNSRLGERFHGSQPDNNAVVYGTEECLTDALDYIRENRAPSILLIENSCSVSLIGDDIEGIAAKAKLPFSAFPCGQQQVLCILQKQRHGSQIPGLQIPVHQRFLQAGKIKFLRW